MRDSDVRGRLTEMASGVFVEQDTLHIAEKIREYDDNLRLQYLDPSHFDAGVGDAPWRVLEKCRDGQLRVVLTAWELDDRVLERLYAADTQRHNLMAIIDGKNELVKQETERRYREEGEEIQDIIVSYLESPKGRWSVEHKGRKITLDDDPGRKSKVERKPA